jgi:hypothetical protein
MHAAACTLENGFNPVAQRNAGGRSDSALSIGATGRDALPFRAWRGGSGRRYVVSVYPLDEADDGYAGAVLLAVARDADGRRRIVGARETLALGLTGVNGNWMSAMRAQGANELHVHLLAATGEERRFALDDLAA